MRATHWSNWEETSEETQREKPKGEGDRGSDDETNHGKTEVKLSEGFILSRTNVANVCTAVESTQKQDLSLPETL